MVGLDGAGDLEPPASGTHQKANDVKEPIGVLPKRQRASGYPVRRWRAVVELTGRVEHSKSYLPKFGWVCSRS